MNKKLLEINDLHVQYTTERSVVKALNGINLVMAKGESLGLVGETGAGKTTIALSILNLLPKSNAKIIKGEILFNGKSVMEMSQRELLEMRGGKIAMVFQNPLTALNPVFTVGHQIAMVLKAHQDITNKEAKQKTEELLEMVGIPGYRGKEYPMQYSGGMRQRVGIAAALACNPQILIADEPTTALDVTIQAQILEIMKTLEKKYDTSLLMITHNLGIIAELCKTVAVMYAGRIIEQGPVKEVFSQALHPYTKGLLGALPSVEGEKKRLQTIPGRIADSQNLPPGCPFHPRCNYCMPVCKSDLPTPSSLGNDHYLACHLAGRSLNG